MNEKSGGRRRNRLFALLLMLCLLLSCAAEAENQPAEYVSAVPEVLDVLERTERGSVWIGIAVPLIDGLAVTASGILPARVQDTLLTDGVHVWPIGAAIPDENGVVTTLFYNGENEKPLAPPYTVISDDDWLPGLWTVRTGDAEGNRHSLPLESAAALTWQEEDSRILKLPEQAALGSPVLTENGYMAGLVAAEYAEGLHRVIAVTTDEVLEAVQNAFDMLAALQQEDEKAPEGYRVTADGNLVTFDWSEMPLPETAEGEKVYLVVADTENDYLTYVSLNPEQTVFQMVLTPGRAYVSGFVTGTNPPSGLPEASVLTILPEAERVKEHGFRSVLWTVAEDRGGTEPERAEITEELLRSGKAYIYSHSVYEIDTEETDTLLITLTDPSGNNYRYLSSWSYAPAYMERDVWYLPFTETGLLDSLNAGGYPRGAYELNFYIGDELADSMTFELK